MHQQLGRVMGIAAAMLLAVGLCPLPLQAMFEKQADAPVPLTIGDAVPPLEIETLLNAPDGATATFDGDLAGKVVVLEFWATWCGPCVASVPHLNELTEALADEDVVFISVTNEEQAKVEDFLKSRPITGWVGLDPDNSAAKHFNVRGIPRTIVIDREGNIAADTYPTRLNEEHLHAALAGEAVDAPPTVDASEIVPLHGSDSEPTLAEAWIRPTVNPDGSRSTMMGSDKIVITNLPATDIVTQLVTGRWASRKPVELRAELPGADLSPEDQPRYDLFVKVPQERQFQIDDLALHHVAFAFGLLRYEETRDTDVYLLEAIPGQEGKLPKSAGEERVIADQHSEDGMTINQSATTANGLLFSLRRLFKRPVRTEWESPHRFDLEAGPFDVWNLEDAERLELVNEALAEFGLRLVPAVRPVTFIIIDERGSYQDEKAEATTRPSYGIDP
ncbi:MAG: redoxin family protein [Planctomycetota bacterium]